MIKLFLALTSLYLASASAAALEDPPSFLELDNDYLVKVTEPDLPNEFTTILPDVPNVNSCTYPGTCPPSIDARNCQRCKVGFVKDPNDATKCKYANDDENAFLLTSSNANINFISLDTKISTQMMQDGNYSISRGIDYNIRTNKIFWFSHADKTIYTAPLLNYVASEKQSIMHDNSSSVHGIAVDWIYNHIYWVDLKKDELVVSNFNGTMKKVLFNNGFKWPLSIVVNPLSGWMYWADSNLDQIQRASMDGSRREIILGAKIKDPQGLALDFVENRLYWSQGSSYSSIWSSNFDGSDQKMIFQPTESQFTGGDFRKIAMFDKFIYLMDWSSDVVYKVNKCNGQNFEMVHNSTFSLWDIKTYHSTMQPEGENLCSKRIDQCSHFCFPASSPGKDSVSVSTTTCACPDGLYLSSDQRNCVSELTTLMPV